MSLPGHDRVRGQAPTLVLTVIAAGSLWRGARLSDRRVDPAPGEADAATWFARLAGLLRGRHHLSSRTVRSGVTDARGHVVASGATHPAQELGTPETYAWVVAAQTDESIRRGARLTWFVRLGALSLLGFVVVAQVLDDGATWWTWTGAVALVLIGRDLVDRRRDVGAAG